MLSAEQWWAIMTLYGETVWPAQIVLYLAAVGATAYVLIRPGERADTVMRLYLGTALTWTSLVFFALIGHDLAGNIVFATLFGIAAVFFSWDLRRKTMTFRPPTAGLKRYAFLALVALVFSYPVVSLALGHVFPKTIVPGTFPCPTTALTLLMMSLALPQASKIPYLLLLFWAVPLPVLIQIPKYGVFEDAIMFTVGIYALGQLILHWSQKRPQFGRAH